MTLVVATSLPDGGAWIGADKLEGGHGYHHMRWSKIHRMTDPDGFTILVGFAGSARVAQALLRLELPPRRDDTIEEWMTRFCDTIHDRAESCGLLKPASDDEEPYLAGSTAITVAAEGQIFMINDGLHWSAPASGWAANGSAAEIFAGAYTVHLDLDPHDPVAAARRAWPIAQQHYHVGPLVDELTLPA